MEDLESAIADMKSGKAKDHQKLAMRLFKKENCSIRLWQTLLKILNMSKKSKILASNVNTVMVTCIAKEGSQRMLKNMRGIFNVSLVRSILMRMIYNRHYASIDKNLSDNNLGARKGKSGLMNIFVANSILNDVSRDSSQDPISVKIFDFTQMYDSLVLQKCTKKI